MPVSIGECVTVRECQFCGDKGENCFCAETPEEFLDCNLVKVCKGKCKKECDGCVTVRECQFCGDRGENCFCAETPENFLNCNLVKVCKGKCKHQTM
jgi:hypothetical protein